jgi:hypothetical protein
VLGGRRGCVCYVLLTLGCLPLPADYPFDRRQSNCSTMIMYSIPVGYAIDRTWGRGEPVTVRSKDWV